MSKESPDPVIERIRKIFADSEKTLDELGIGLGRESGTARKAAWQLLNKVRDPRISSLRKFCQVMGIEMADLFTTEKKKARPK